MHRLHSLLSMGDGRNSKWMGGDYKYLHMSSVYISTAVCIGFVQS